MFSIADGREHFYQWDSNRQIVVNDPTIHEVHFCNKTDDCSLIVEVKQTTIFADFMEIDVRVADVPNILLQNDFPIRVYAYCKDGYTKVERIFKVISRTKPNDYVYTETEVKRWEDIAERADKALEEAEKIMEDGIGTKVSVNGEEVATFDADTKVDNKAFNDAINQLEDDKLSKGNSIENHADFLYVHKLDSDKEHTGQYVRMRGDIFEAYYKTDAVQVQGQYTINGAELYKKEFDENGNITKSFNTKYHRDCIEGNNDAGKYFKLNIPRVAGTKTIATTADITTQIANNYNPLKADVDKLQKELNSTKTQLNDSSKRTGDWYSGETMKKGINLSIGRMYVCTGVGVKLVTSSGDELFDTNGETITPDGAKVVAVIMPNQVSYPYGHTEYAAYRCKAIWGSSSLFGSNFEAKDFLLETYDTGIKAVAEGGTSIWSM